MFRLKSATGIIAIVIAPAVSRAWLRAALATGLLFGLAQQLRGAHFMSHTLWSAWVCWMMAWTLYLPGAPWGRA